MEVVRLEALAPRGSSAAVTVGNFDGVHRGHQALVAATRAAARRWNGEAVVLTFDPHPARVVSPERSPLALMTLDQKAEVLSSLGVDRLAVLPFTAERSRESPAEFARLVLQQSLGARSVVVGANFRFGHDRAGDLAVLEQLGRELGFEVLGLPPVLEEGEPVSSTRVRQALARGGVEEARRLLGRPFFVDGKVVRGEGRGRTLGIPTANLDLVNESVPARGVYAGRCLDVTGGGSRSERRAGLEATSEEPWPAVVNVGQRPTFGGGETTVEAHLLDFRGDLYGRTVRLEFEARLRDERAFPGVDALVTQIGLDIEEARFRLRP